MSSFRRKLWKWTAGTFAVLVILLGLALGVFRIVLAQVPDYRAQIQAFISRQSGLDIAFSELDARWRLYGPELVFENAVVSAPNGGRTLVQARRGSVALDIWASLASLRITTGRFWLDGPQLFLVRTAAGRIELVGQDELPERTRPFLFDELPTGRFSISDAKVTFRDLATGRGPWTFARVGLTLQRGADSMRLAGTAELPSALGKQMQFAARSSGQLDDPTALNWDFEVESRDLALAGLADLLPDAWPAPTTGNGSFKVAGVLKGAQIETLKGNVSLAGIMLPLPVWSAPLPGADPLVLRSGEAGEEIVETIPAGPAPLATGVVGNTQRTAYDVVRADFDVKRTEDGGWHLLVDGLQLVRPGVRWDPSRVEVDVDGPGAGAVNLRGSAAFLSLDGVWPLLAYLPERADTAQLRALAARGRVRDMVFAFKRSAPDAPPEYSFSGRLEAVGFSPVGAAPGLAGITGQFLATDRSGRFELAARNFEFNLPRLFREPLLTDEVSGTLTWKHEADRWRVASDAVSVRDADGNGTAKFTFDLPDDGSSPVLDLEGSGTDIDAKATPRYLPAGRMSMKSLAWLDRAFPDGRVATASIEYRGPTRLFPFRGGEGTFIARGQFDGITLDYDPRWIPLVGLKGNVEFHNAGLTARTVSGEVHGLRLGQAQVDIADFRSVELDIRAQGGGDLGAALDFLQHSSVGPALGDRFMALEGKGASTFEARLQLPIRQMEDRKIDVVARLVNAEVAERGRSQKITALNGPLQVLDRALVSPGLQGRFLGGPVSFAMAAENDVAAQSTATVLTANGRALVGPLKEFLGVPDVVRLNGAAAWQLRARFVPPPVRKANAAQLASSAPPVMAMTQLYVIDSDLQGLGIALPEPVQKPAASSRKLHVEVELDGGPALTIRGSLGELRTVARLKRANGEWAFDRAGVRADGVAASIPGHEGVRIEGDVENVVLDDWLALRGSGAGAGPSGGRRLGDYLKAANVRIGSFGLFGYSWTDVRGLLQATPAGWQIDVAGPDATGKLLVPYELGGTAPMTLEMERLVLASKGTAAGGQSTTDPRQVPPIQAHINDFELGGRKLGNVRAQLDRVPRGLVFTNVTAQSATFSAEAKGTWLANEGPTPAARSIATDVDLTLTSTDVQTTLKALGYGDVVAGTRGLLQAKLSWAGGPDAQALGRASGTVHLEIDDGQMLDLQPGAGRMLGLLSVAALPRRLSLDFSDLTDKGLAFDAVRGDFELKQGNAYTDNLKLTGPAADIGIAGRTGLGARDYDQTAVVTGNFGATLPVAGALAGGPVGAAAMLLFSQVFKEPLKGMTRGYYRITGNWDEPQVERVVASDAKEAAAHAPATATPATP
ncbi:MAG: YhdP family protein [Steroidobacteraceae bacterium]